MSEDLTPADRQRIVDALYTGQKLQAIKHYREATGVGLKESKDFIDGLEQTLRKEHPERMQSTTSGCSSTASLLMIVVLAIIAGAWAMSA
ncbi:ribosomal protein L7/L12 [Rubinisphaera margarita]|uniref:ribosomal protein L7/L12 n=1 Tax=Rubinisphaera margarita TaxID=2909586 RepID=UPI001EE8FDCB|nr:ribosomal protein L7/L12 [Rubinisphaera margarita]MCG6158515.1 ribosomal protein L7/L12 [Rubinisphaera margarita]